MKSLTAILLAAGRSTRMGANKLLLPWGEKRVLSAVVENLLSLPLEEVIAVVGHQRAPVEALLAQYPVRIVYNPDYGEGLSTSIKRGVAAASDTTTGYLFALGDMPQVQSSTIVALCRAFSTAPPRSIAVPVLGQQRGNPVLFHRAYREELLQLTGDRGAKSLMQRYPQEVLEVQVDDPGTLLDVDTPEAYRAGLESQGD